MFQFEYLNKLKMASKEAFFETYKPAPARFSVIRLHGGDRGEIEKETGEVWNRIVAPKPQALQAAARITVENIRQKIKTIVNVNNHFEGSAPLTIERFLDTLKKESASHSGHDTD